MSNRPILAQWLKPDGAHVQPGDLLCIIETDKTTQELEAHEPGILRHLKKEGDPLTSPTDLPCRIDLPPESTL